jgi:hypothetical protein
VISRELLSGRVTRAPLPAAGPAAAAAPAPSPQPAPQPAPQPSAARFANAYRDRAEAAAAAEEGDAPPQPALPEDQAREARLARVAGLISHAGRLTHLRLPTHDASAWHEQMDACFAPRLAGKGVRLAVLDAGTRADAAFLLGAELAEDGPVVLIDLTMADAERRPGLSELLSGDATFADIIDRDPQSRLHVIGAGRAGREAVLAAGDLVEIALDALTDAYRHVLIEAPTREVHRLAGVLMPLIDGAVVIADSLSNGHAVETAYKVSEGHDLPVVVAVFEEPAPAVRPDPRATVAV